MGFVDWLKGVFGKQPCAFCGNEVGMLKRTKIKNKEFICTDCGYGCSPYIQKYRYTKDELLGHMEYMKRQDALYQKIGDAFTMAVPSATSKQSVVFYDDYGMFRVRDRNTSDRYLKEFFRYDQVAKYEPYLEESDADEPNKPKVFGECGVDITLVGAADDMGELRKGLRAHPYVTETIRVCLNDRDKRIGELEVNQVICHFNGIFGVNDDTKGLFSFGPTKQQKREGEALKAMTGMFGAAIKAAKTGEVSEEAAALAADAMNKVDDAATGGLSAYTRLADEAEANI